MTGQPTHRDGPAAWLKQLAPLTWRRAWRRFGEARSMARLKGVAPTARGPGPRSLDDAQLQLVGYLGRPSGVGAAARGLLAAARQAGLCVHAVDCEDSAAVRAWTARVAEPQVVNLLVLNPDSLARFATRMGPRRLASAHCIGHWVWELEKFPQRFLPACRLVREVWTPSRFVQTSIARSIGLTVRRLPYAVVSRAVASDRAAWKWQPDEFIGLTVCDLRSEVTRKRPDAAIAAFRQAFTPGSKARLVIKVQNVDHDPAAWRDLRALAAGRPDIQFINEPLDERRMATLFASCDAYISLHRAEGFGLCLAEAMAQKKPVIATAYSGSSDFVTFETGCPVSYQMTAAARDCGPYPRGARWAEASIEEAAMRWQELAADRQRCARLGHAAARRIAESFSPAIVGQRLRALLVEALELKSFANTRVA